MPNRVETHVDGLRSLVSAELPAPRGHVRFADLARLLPIEGAKEYEASLHSLAAQLPFETSSWPSFDEYVAFGYRVVFNPLRYQLQYCERGVYDVRQHCSDAIDLSCHIMGLVSPGLSPSALTLATDLDRINDQRLRLWLQMSSEIYHAFQFNRYFGQRRLHANAAWMCEELVRMGVAIDTAEAWGSKEMIVVGLSLSGMPPEFASALYEDIDGA